MSEFFSMGGFGIFIWSAMGVAMILMILEVFSLIMKRRVLIKQIKRNNRLNQRQRKNQA